ncbi:hypothetical protein [Ralstonia pickettii]|uniref:hypothetical protein n=1 Tax=Ralstonia pickettii TaxID=329 RepID=UPI0008188A85|nr:hypothetical protein [Ralstonia pickettii]
MDEQFDLPLALYKAQLTLVGRSWESVLSARQRWLALGTELLGDDIDEVRAACAELSEAPSWQAAAVMWPNAWWRINQHGVTVLEGCVRTALTSQTAVAVETQRAMRQWQQAIVQAAHIAGTTIPIHGFWQNALAVLGSAPQREVESGLPAAASVLPHRARVNHEHREHATAGG